MADWNQIVREFTFSTSRSGGAGGQHVNKVETRVTICFSITDSTGLTEEEKERLLKRYPRNLENKPVICLSVQKHRSQIMNKNEAIEKMKERITRALLPPKKRKRTTVPEAEKQKRLEDKKTRSMIKTHRKKPNI
jgi:ribosome-associated protein